MMPETADSFGRVAGLCPARPRQRRSGYCSRMHSAGVATRNARVVGVLAALALFLLVAGLGAPRLDEGTLGNGPAATWHRDAALQQATADTAVERRLPVDGGFALVLVMFAAVLWTAPESGPGEAVRSRWQPVGGRGLLSRVRAPPRLG